MSKGYVKETDVIPAKEPATARRYPGTFLKINAINYYIASELLAKKHIYYNKRSPVSIDIDS